MASVRWTNSIYNLDDKNTLYDVILDLDTRLQSIGLISTTGNNSVDYTNKPYPTLTAGSPAPATNTIGVLHYLLPTGNGVVQFEDDPVNIGYKRIVNASYDSTPVKIEIEWILYRISGTNALTNDVTISNYKKFYTLQPRIVLRNPSNLNSNITFSWNNFIISSNTATYNGNKTAPFTESYITLDNEFFAIGWNNAKMIDNSTPIQNTASFWELQLAFNRRNGIISALGLSNEDTKAALHKHSKYIISENDKKYYEVISSSVANLDPTTTSTTDYYSYRFSNYYSGITGTDIGYYPLYCNDIINNDYYAIPILITKVGNTQVIQENLFAVKYRGENVVHKFIKIGHTYGGFSPYNSTSNIFTWQIKHESYPCTTSNL